MRRPEEPLVSDRARTVVEQLARLGKETHMTVSVRRVRDVAGVGSSREVAY